MYAIVPIQKGQSICAINNRLLYLSGLQKNCRFLRNDL